MNVVEYAEVPAICAEVVSMLERMHRELEGNRSSDPISLHTEMVLTRTSMWTSEQLMMVGRDNNLTLAVICGWLAARGSR